MADPRLLTFRPNLNTDGPSHAHTRRAAEVQEICRYIDQAMDPAYQVPLIDPETSARFWEIPGAPPFSLTSLGLRGTPTREDLIIALLSHLATLDFTGTLKLGGCLVGE